MGVGLRHRSPLTFNLSDSFSEKVKSHSAIKKALESCHECQSHTSEELEALYTEFEKHSTENVISLLEFQNLIYSRVGDSVSLNEIPTLAVELWTQFDDNRSNTIDFGEFVRHIPRLNIQIMRRAHADKASRLFETHCTSDGRIGPEELVNMMKSLSLICPTITDAQRLIANSNRLEKGFDRDDFITFLSLPGSLRTPTLPV